MKGTYFNDQKWLMENHDQTDQEEKKKKYVGQNANTLESWE